jgi:hypothetical protein
VTGLERLVGVIRIDPQGELLRRQPVIPVDHADRADVVAPEPRQRRQRGGDAGAVLGIGKQALIRHPWVESNLLGDERAQIGAHGLA